MSISPSPSPSSRLSASQKKKQKQIVNDSPSPQPSPEPFEKLAFESTLSYQPLSNLAHAPSSAYLQALAQVVDFKRHIQHELIAIAEDVQRTSGKSKKLPVLETPRKKLLSAQVELARMDFMEQKAIGELIYQSSHFGTDLASKDAFDAQQAMQEVQHILDLYDELRKNLAIKAHKRSKVNQIGKLLFIISYTALFIPLFLLALLIQPLNVIFKAPNHFQPVDMIQKLYARGFLFLCGVTVYWNGMEHVNYDASTLGMFSHSSNLDPVIVASGPLAWKWIGKKSLFKIPVIGWLLSGLKHIPIERENREKAIASLKKAAEIIHKNKRCVAVSPEGTRSKSGRILDFKKGAFHTAMEVGVPITPLLIEGAYELWPSGSIFASAGSVSVTCLKPITIGPKDTYNTLASKVRRAFYEQLLKSANAQLQAATSAKREQKGKEYVNFALHSSFLPITYAILYVLYLGAKTLF